MRASLALTAILSAILWPSFLCAQQGNSLEMRFEPEIGYLAGETQYDMLYPAVEGASGFTGLRSLLEFPLRNPVVGVSMRLSRPRTVRYPLAATLTVATDIGDPSAKMRDGDWWLSGNGSDFKFSYTESEPKLSYLLVNLEARVTLPNDSRFRFDLVGGARYTRIVQDIDNFVGWQYDTLFNFYELDGHTRALYYRITYVSPFVGLRLYKGNPHTARFHIQAALAPTHVSDVDDHFLRHKYATAAGWGEGVIAESGLRIPLQKSNLQSSFLEFKLKFNYVHASPKQTQSWYGDDPYTDEDDTGNSAHGVPHEITLTELNFGVKLGFGL